ncbi:MAG: hypothetical protein ABI693_26285 [Bryobacteraceae bacterium]
MSELNSNDNRPAEPSAGKRKAPRTPKQVATSRANGSKSKGPKTQEGKDISKMNAFKHGYYGEFILLPGESHAGHAHLHEAYLHRFQPQDHSEFACVEQLVKLQWEMRRAWTDQRNSVIIRIDDQRPRFDREFFNAHPSLRITRAHQAELTNGEFGLALDRRLERLDRSFDRTLRRLDYIRAHFPLPSDYPTDLCERYDHQQNRHLLNQRNEPKVPVTPPETVPCEKPQPALEPAAAAQPSPKRIFTPPAGFSYLDFDPEPVPTPEVTAEIPSEPPAERTKIMRAAA